MKTSKVDRKINQEIKNGGKLLDIDVPDHLILTSESYLSMADEGEIQCSLPLLP